MISVTAKKQLLDTVVGIFPGKTVKGSTNSDGSAELMTVVVDAINHHQINELSHFSRTNDISIDMKRSGTGISIKFS